MNRLAVTASGVAALLALSGCAAFSDDSGSGSASSAGKVEVVAAFYPLQYAAQRVAGTHADVANLTTPGGEPHDLELGVKDTAELAEADLVVYEHGFQPAVDDAVDADAQGATVDAAEVVKLVPFRDHGVDSDETDPHFWQDPLMLADVADKIADELAQIDPDDADDYRTNAASLRADLEKLDGEYRTGLTGCARSTIVVSHDAFGYLERYGLTMESILGLSPDAEATPADLARLQRLVRTDGITTIFSEELVSPKTAETLARDTGVQSAVLDPIEGLSDETADQDYLSLMRSNLVALRKANGC